MTDKEKLDKLFTILSEEDHYAAIKRNKTKLCEAFEVKDEDELVDNSLYKIFYNRIIGYKTKINDILALPEDNQVVEALDFLSYCDLGDKNNFEYIIKLIEVYLMPKWSAKNIERFLTGKDLIIEWVHFFISYTNQSSPSVNNDFRNVLLNQYSNREIDENNSDKKNSINMVAKLLDYYFRVQKVYSFYDKKDIGWGDEWRKTIFNYTKKSYVLFQFIETEIFQKGALENFCYQEYESYKSSIERFIQTNNIDGVEPKKVYLVKNPDNLKDYSFEPSGAVEPEIKEWIADIKKTQYVSIYKEMPVDLLKQTIQGKALEIDQWRKSILDKYIANLRAQANP